MDSSIWKADFIMSSQAWPSFVNILSNSLKSESVAAPLRAAIPEPAATPPAAVRDKPTIVPTPNVNIPATTDAATPPATPAASAP